MPRVRLCSRPAGAAHAQRWSRELDELTDVRDDIERSLIDEPGALVRDGGFIRDGVDAELDDLRRISRSGKQVIAELEEHERTRTGIGSLKVRYNRVFGYYIEISKSNLHAVPADYHPQTDHCRRRALHYPGAEGIRREGARRRRAHPRARVRALRDAARARRRRSAAHSGHGARAGDARCARRRSPKRAARRNYIKPHVHDGDELASIDGRHPVVERRCNGAFVPNDVDARRHDAASS